MSSEISEGGAESQRLLLVESWVIITGSYIYDEPADESDERLIPLAKVPMVVFSEAVANVESIMST